MLATAGALLAGCSREADGPQPAKGESVTIAMPLVLHSALVLLAVEKRCFAEQGLNVVVKPMASGAGAIEALARGQADLALNSETAFVLAALDKKNVRLLATLYRSRANMSIVARKASGIARPRDLAGKRLGVIANTGADYFADLYLGLQDIEPGEVTRVALKVGEAEQALLEGNVDAVALFHPHNSRLVARLGGEAVVFSEPAVYQMQFNLVARREFADSRPDAARRFLLALQAALTFMRENPEAARLLTIEATKEDAATFGKVWQVSDFMLGLNQDLLSVLEDEARWAMARKPAAAAPSFLEFIDARPLQSAVPDAVSILLP
jgi:NitT/TauT family transport system substrate-binding protein